MTKCDCAGQRHGQAGLDCRRLAPARDGGRNTRTIGDRAIHDEWSRLAEASRKLIAERGLAKFSLRTLASESGWTIGELSYRLGNKNQLIEKLLTAENDDWQAADDLWLSTVSGVRSFDRGELAAIIAAYLDHLASGRRLASIVRYEMLMEQGVPVHRQMADWDERGHRFWHRLLDGRLDEAATFARVVHAYVAGELLFTLALGHEPAYRVVRQVCIHRLCNGILGSEEGSDGELLNALCDRQSANEPSFAAYSERAWATAAAAGRLMMERGVAAVTHRSVGDRLGISGSAVAYHFPTRPDLFAAAIDALNDEARRAREADVDRITKSGTGSVDAIIHEPIYTFLLRSFIITALAATRDAAFQPVVRRLRIERGKHSYVENTHLRGRKGFDRWAAQASSMVMFGASIQAAAQGEALSVLSASLRSDLDLLAR